jgi:hypothetical protein
LTDAGSAGGAFGDVAAAAIIPVAEVAKTRAVDEPSYSSDAGKAGRWQFDYQEDQYSRLVNILFFDNASALAILR